MAVIETKYSVDDVVYHATTVTERKRHDCPDCLGEGKWKALSPAGREYEFTCPRCGDQYQSNADLSLNYTVVAPRARRLTIGSVQVDTAATDYDRDQVSYMCRETGVGSGSVYNQCDLFPTEEEALAAATNIAAARNAETEWIVKLYDKTLSLSDYQMGDAALKAAKEFDGIRRARIQTLFYDFEGAESVEDFRDAIARWKEKK